MLGWRGAADKDAVPDLIVALSDSFGGVRANAAKPLARIGAETKEAVPALITVVRGEPLEGVWRNAVKALGMIGPDAKEAVRALCEALSDTRPERRYRAVNALGLIGPSAKDAVSPLIDRLTFDPVWEVRRNAADALGRIGPAVEVVSSLGAGT